VRYDNSAVWIYFTGVESWEQARIWGQDDAIGIGGFAFYVDVNGNTYYDPWCCQNAYYNNMATPAPTSSPTVAPTFSPTVTPMFSPTAVPVPSSTPIPAFAIWHMDTCVGDWIYDFSLNGYNGEIYGSTWTYGLLGCALDFDGVDDYVEITDPISDLESFTLSAWVWGQEQSRYQRILNGSGAFFNFRIHPNNTYQLELWNGSSWIPVTVQNIGWTTETWHHIAATYNYNTYEVKIYVDGVQAEINNSTVAAAPRSGKLWIGGYQPNEYFNGIIDEVSIYDEALSGAAIMNLFLEVAEPAPTPAL
jgi:hypothetical protein